MDSDVDGGAVGLLSLDSLDVDPELAPVALDNLADLTKININTGVYIFQKYELLSESGILKTCNIIDQNWSYILTLRVILNPYTLETYLYTL